MPAPMAPAPMTATVASRGSGPPIARASAAGEARRPLGEERGDAFAIVVAVAELALDVALEVELGFERVVDAGVQRALDGGEAARGRLRELRDQALDRGRQFGVVAALPDETPGGGLLGRQLVAEQRKPHRAC